MKKHVAWQLPRGVSGGTWDYSQTVDIADSYDAYFSNHGLFDLDESVVRRHTQAGDCLIDLGCGTGRAILPLLERGIDCVAFDLSQPMLSQVQAKAGQVANKGSLMCVRGNLVDLSCWADASFDQAICLFSTLGMIRGHDARREFVAHVSRILKPGGIFILQVHNYWVHVFDPEGPWWMLKNAARTLVRRDVELGDRFYPYRGIPDMFLHSFSCKCLRKILSDAGFQIVEMLPLNASQDKPLFAPNILSGLRASGWIVVAQTAHRK